MLRRTQTRSNNVLVKESELERVLTVIRIEIDGVSTACRFDGLEGAPVVMFSNSLGADMTMWDAQAKTICDRFRVLRYDTRGHGLSQEPSSPFGMDDLAGDALAVMDHFDLDHVHFVGLSLGGMIGQTLGALHGDRLSSLTLCATASTMDPSIWSARIAQVQSQGVGSLVETSLERWFTESFRTATPDVVAKIGAAFARTSDAGYIGCASAIRDMDLVPMLEKIAGPTLVVAGANDPSTPPAAGKVIADAVEGASLTVIDQAAHFLNVEQAAGFNDILLHFLGDQEHNSLASHVSSEVTA